MNIIEAITNRRSIRKFIKKDIDKNILVNILKAGINAPSPKNNQPWKFVVLTSESKNELIKIIKDNFEDIKSSFGLLINEKKIFIICGSDIKNYGRSAGYHSCL